MAKDTISVNRAPVLTLWAAVVAKRLGYAWDEALTLGKAVAGLNAQSKGRRLGIYETPTPEQREERQAQHPRGTVLVDMLGRSVPARKTAEGVRALTDGKAAAPTAVERYLRGKFGERYEDARAAMEELADSYEPKSWRRRRTGFTRGFARQCPAAPADGG